MKAVRAERLGKWIDVQFGGNRSDCARASGMKPQQLSEYLSGKKIPGGDILTKWADLGLNISWWATGIGDMQIDHAKAYTSSERTVVDLVDTARLIRFLEHIESEAAAIRQSITEPTETAAPPVARARVERLDPEAAQGLTEIMRGASTAKPAETGKRKKTT